MARKNNDRYVRFYTFGSTAAKLAEPEKKAILPKYHPQPKRKPIPFDPFTLAGNVVAVLLAVLMIVGMFQVGSATAEVRQLEAELQALEQQEQMLLERYYGQIDLDEIRVAAESMGMIPAEDAVHVRVQLPAETVQVQQISWWDSVLVSLRQFFA